MGCTASKLDNEDTVRRCKDRRRLIQAAVTARHHLAAAHSDYCRSLRLTGSSLSTFAQGEPLPVSPQTPSILLTTPTTATSKLPKYHQTNYTNTPQSSFSSHSRKPSNLPPNYVNTPQSHSRSSSNLPPNFTPKQNNAAPPPPVATSAPRRYQKPNTMKLPHILSDSSFSSSPPHDFTYKASSNYQNTPSQASSVWNWENFYPPSPPDSEFYENNHKHKDAEFDKASVRSEHFRKEDDRDKASVYSDFFDKSSVQSERFRTRKEDDRDKASVYSVKSERFRSVKHEEDGASVYSDFFDRRKSEHHLDTEEGETEREEVQYSEWDDHYNTTSSSSSEGEERVSPRSEIRSNYAASVRADPRAEVEVPKYEESLYGDGENEISNDMRMVVRHKDLAEIVAAIREYFDKAASAGEQVGEMLETGRAQLDRSFSKLKKTVYHSSGVFSNLSSSWTSKPPLAVKYRMEQSSIVEPGGPKSLCSTLERLLAWEKKLYQEVKAREGVKIEHEKKLASLQSQEYRGGNEAKLDKTKTEINRLQSLIVVTSQAVSTTSSAIIGVRDAELVPQLVELCHGFMYMWRSMNQFHEVQNQIVQQVRGLVNRTTKGESTSDLHRQATRDLESAVSAWHSSFCRLIKFQRDFIRSLHGWYKLTLVPLDNETINKNIDNNEAFSFYDEWKLALDQLPDTVASEAIKSFINVVHSISMKQTEELKIKKRTETASKELEKKATSLRSIEKKYYHSYSMVGIGLPDTGPDNGHMLDARDPLAEKKFELETCRRRVEEEMLRHSKAVEVTRAMTLNNIQTGLPGVFQAMTSFSQLIMEALETVCTRSYAIK